METLINSTFADVSETDFNCLGNGALTFNLRMQFFNATIAELKVADYLILRIVFSNENKFHMGVTKAYQW